jgi:alcohol dehydrogenase
MLPEYFEFSLPTKLVYGVGILGNIGESVKVFGNRKAILVTDEVLVKTGLVEKVKAGFKASPIKIACTFDKVPPNSTIDAVEQCAAMAKKKACNLFIAVGGGSVIDTAKVANILVVKGGLLQDHMGAYLLDSSEQLLPPLLSPPPPGQGPKSPRWRLSPIRKTM